jgi:hypothetical protein
MRRAIMRHIFFAAVVGLALTVTAQDSRAQECWAVSNLKGYSAFSDQGYRFVEDGLKNVVVCFTADSGGTVTGTDIRFVKYGTSTLAGYGGNERGNELFEVYQLDREKRKLLYVKTRIGTKTVIPVFSDVTSSFVGDAVQVSR